ncbi:MAG: branched-chain amino acid ABC transporter permease [Pseudomonadota bacterium]
MAAVTDGLRGDTRAISRESVVNGLVLLGLVAAAVLGAVSDEPFVVTLATKVAILGLAGVGLNLALGSGGLISLGHAAFFGVGGYVAGILASHAQNYEPILTSPITIEGTQQMLIIWPLAVVVGGAVAAAVGALSIRSSGVYFIMITLAFAQMIYYFAISWPAYGGEDGLPIYVRNSFPLLNTLDGLQFFALAFGVLCAGIFLVARLNGSHFGLALQCARQCEHRLTSIGIAPYPVRLIAFTISGAITALAGALYADLNRFVSPDMLAWHTSGEIMVFVILGGVGRLCGPVVGAATFILLEHWLGGLTEYWKALLGLLLVGIVLYVPGGIMRLLAGAPRHA